MDDQKENKHTGVFIAARKIKNEGKILSEGAGARTEIITEDYQGSGIIKSKSRSNREKKNWFSMDNPFIWIIASFIILVISFLLYKYLLI